MNETNGAQEEPQRAYHVLMNSRRYGTSAFACPTLQEAAAALSWLAVRAAQEQHEDGAQRFFCLLPPDLHAAQAQEATYNAPDTPEGADAVVLCLSAGALQWIAGDAIDNRPLIVLDAMGSEEDGPFVCWEACARPLASLGHRHRHAVNRYLLLRHLRRGQEGHDDNGDEDQEVDPLVRAWQQSHPEETFPLVTLAAGEEAQHTDGGYATVRKEVRR